MVKLGNNEIEKKIFHRCKIQILINDVNIDKIFVSSKVPFGKKGFKYFIGYENNYVKVISLCILLPKISVYRGNFEETKPMSFLTKDNELLEKYNKI